MSRVAAEFEREDLDAFMRRQHIENAQLGPVDAPSGRRSLYFGYLRAWMGTVFRRRDHDYSFPRSCVEVRSEGAPEPVMHRLVPEFRAIQSRCSGRRPEFDVDLESKCSGHPLESRQRGTYATRLEAVDGRLARTHAMC